MSSPLNTNAFIKHLAALLLFGFNGIVASKISLPSFDIVFLRTLIGSVLLCAIFLLSGGRFHLRAYPRDLLFILISGVAMGVSWMLLYEAYTLIGVSISTLLYYCGPVLVMALSPLLFKERLTAPKLGGFALVLLGIFLVNGTASGAQLDRWGLGCAALSAVMYFFMVTMNKQATHIGGLENSLLQLIVSFVTVAIFVGFKQHFAFTVPSSDWPWILLLGLVNTGLGCYLYFSPLALLPVQTVAICGYLEPLSAVVFAALLLHEQMSPLQVLGAALIIGGAMVGNLLHSRP